MDKLTQHVKSSMLSYPTLYKTRLDVLKHLYLVLGNGYEWNNGVLTDRCGSRVTKDMYYDDLTEEGMKERAESVGFPNYIHTLRERAGAERAEREDREKRIDEIASHVDMNAICVDGYYASPTIIVQLSNSGYLRVPTDAEASYRAGAIEILTAVLNGSDPADPYYEPLKQLRSMIEQRLEFKKLKPKKIEKIETWEQRNTKMFKGLVSAFQNRGFKQLTHGTSGSGSYLLYEGKPMDEAEAKLFVRYLSRLGVIKVGDNKWENEEHFVRLELTMHKEMQRGKFMILTHPNDINERGYNSANKKRWVNAVFSGYDDLFESYEAFKISNSYTRPVDTSEPSYSYVKSNERIYITKNRAPTFSARDLGEIVMEAQRLKLPDQAKMLTDYYSRHPVVKDA